MCRTSVPVIETILVCALLVLSGCDPHDGTTPADCRGGSSLAIAVQGLAQGEAIVTVGQGTEKKQVTDKPTCFMSGEYEVVVEPVTKKDSVVRRVFTGTWSVSGKPSSSTLELSEGVSYVINVQYVEVPSSNKLWVGNGNSPSDMVAFSSSALVSSATIGATVKKNGTMDQAGGLAFDKEGNLWVVERAVGEYAVKRYSAQKLAATGDQDNGPDITIKGGGDLTGATNLAFDQSGNLWVGAASRHRIVMFKREDISKSNNVPATVQLGGGQDSMLNDPDGLAFDSAGNLWVADTTANQVVRYDSRRLQSYSDAKPDFLVQALPRDSATGLLETPTVLAFDLGGNLWVAYNAARVIARLDKDDLQATGEKRYSPHIQFRLAGVPNNARLEGLAFDEDGGLWISYGAGKSVVRLTKAQLDPGEDIPPEVTPATVINSNDFTAAEKIAFFPAPAGLGLFHSLP